MKKYNIAIIGTFDLENFGDLMFPIIFKRQVETRINLDNLFLFSPNSCKMPLNPENIDVYSIDQLENIHKTYNLDAIIFGGGDLARLDNAFAPQDNYIPTNTSFDLMVYSSVIANKYNIPMLWNCPGVPFEFAEDDAKIVKLLVDEFIQYTSVRDHMSAKLLKKCGCNKEIAVSPDTVLSVSSIFGKNENGIFDNLCAEFSFLENGYIVFQSAPNSSEEYKKTVLEQLAIINKKTEKKIVFLPIGNVHSDDKYISELLLECDSNNFVTFDRKLNIFETNAVLANAYAFVGTSLHGNIVSNSYGVPSVALNMFDLVKIKYYFSLVNREEFCISDITTLSDTLLKATQNDTLSSINATIDKIGTHFDRLVEGIDKYTENNTSIKELLTLCYNRADSYNNNISFYYDSGNGFSEENKKTYSYNGNFNEISMRIELPEGTKALRIDPADNTFCVVYNLSINDGNKNLTISNNAAFPDSQSNALIFLNDDPQIILSSLESVEAITLKCSIITANDKSELGKFFSLLSPEFEKLSEEFCRNYNQVIKITQENSDLESTVNHLESTVNHLENVVSESNKTIADLNNAIAQKDESISSLSNQCAEMHRNYLIAHNNYLEIANSFFWRLTSPLRKISHKLKTFIARNRRILEIAIFFKGFLRGGIKLGKERVKNYRIVVGSNSVTAFSIPDFVRKEQTKHKFPKEIKLSILVPLYNTPIKFLQEMIESVQQQTYANWELCLADGSDKDHTYVKKYCLEQAKKDNRIKYKKLAENKGISENTNACIRMATGDYISLFDHDDILHHTALFEIMNAICNKNADFIYTDELTFTGDNVSNVVLYHFKPDYSPDTLRAYNYICHFTTFSKKLLDNVGYFNDEFDGSQDYDLILRLTEKAENIVHIPKVLYFWRSHANSVASDVSAKPYVVDSAKRALKAHLERLGLEGEIEDAVTPTTYKIQYKIQGNPLISILIPNKDHTSDLELCLSSLYEKSTYRNFEVLVIENNSTEEETFEYYKEAAKKYENLKVITWEKGFNYSAINNFAAKQAKGDYILLLNNDIEVITPDWLEQMLMFAQRSDVGAVGAKLYYPNNTIQHAGAIIGLGGVAGHSHKYFPRDNAGYMSRLTIAQNLSACTAACLLVDAKVFWEVGGLDEGFAVAFNDMDFCMSIRKAGHLIVFTPFAELYHHESISRGHEDTPEKIKRFSSEIDRFKNRWQKELAEGDPYYNPNLTLDREDFSFK